MKFAEEYQSYFFDGSSDVCEQLREITGNSNIGYNVLKTGEFTATSVQKHILMWARCKLMSQMNNIPIGKESKTNKKKSVDADQLQEYTSMQFKLVMLLKNLDSVVDMGDGKRSVRSAKYELPIYNRTNKTKYSIGSIHLTALTSGLFSASQQESLIANRFINLQGGRNNIALDEFVEILNRDSKVVCSRQQTALSNIPKKIHTLLTLQNILML